MPPGVRCPIRLLWCNPDIVAEIGIGVTNENFELVVVEHPVFPRPIESGPDLVVGADPGDIDDIIGDGDSQVQKLGIPQGVGVSLVIVCTGEGSTQADVLPTGLKSGWQHPAPLVQIAIDLYRPLHDLEVDGSQSQRYYQPQGGYDTCDSPHAHSRGSLSRSNGKRITSRMLVRFVMIIVNRSMPIPNPAVGGMPISRA